MADFQQLLIVGTITGAINLSNTNDGRSLATFVVRVIERWLDYELRPVLKKTDFLVSCWSQLATIAQNNLDINDRVMVIGTVAAREYNGRGPQATIILELRATQLELLEKATGNRS